jgi:hypothetical protein
MSPKRRRIRVGFASPFDGDADDGAANCRRHDDDDHRRLQNSETR